MVTTQDGRHGVFAINGLVLFWLIRDPGGHASQGSQVTAMTLDTVGVHQTADYWTGSKMAAMAIVTVEVSWMLWTGSMNTAMALATVGGAESIS